MVVEPPEEPVELGGADVVLVDVVPEEVVTDGVVVVEGVHDSVTDETGTLTGSGIADTGVPGGTLTVKVSTWPVASVTVTTQLSAEAVASGRKTAASAATTVANSPVHSLRRLITVRFSSRQLVVRLSLPQRQPGGRY